MHKTQKFKSEKITTRLRGSGHKIPPMTKKLFSIKGAEREKFSVLQWIDSEYETTQHGMDACSRIVG